MTRSRWMTILAIGMLCGAPARADWTRFRGPNGSGIEPGEAKTPVHWTGSANLGWKAQLPGPGVSSPIVSLDRVYVTCYSGYGVDRNDPGEPKALERHLVCLDRKTGKMLWDARVPAVLPEDPYSGIGVTAHGYASHTPVTDGDAIYVFFGKSGALAFDRDGKKLWQTSVGTESDPRRWGSASSPILFENLLIVPASAESEALVALDKKTGKEVWRQEASGLSNSWSTPVLARVDENRVDLVIGVARELWGLNPRTGKLRWYCEGVDGDSFSTSLVADEGVVYAAEGQGGGSIAVRAGGKGNVTESHVLWKGRDSSRFSTPIVHEGKLYSVSGDVMAVIDAKTGERISRARLRGGSGDGGGGRMGGDYSSPVLASGKIYFVKQSGDAFVLDIGGECRQLAVNRVAPEGESFQATPAISQGQIFLRSDKHLYCVADLGQEVPAEPVAKAAAGEAEDDGESPGQDRRQGRGGDRGGSGRGGDRGGFDPQAMFDRSDVDKSGKLEGDEIPERMRDSMDRLDADKDGALTPEEFQKGMSRGGRPGGSGGGGRGSGGGGQAVKRPERPQRPEMDGS